jgi:DNA-binding CsgD family transcriptional regulator
VKDPLDERLRHLAALKRPALRPADGLRRGNLAHVARPGRFDLSGRELEVLALLADGLSNPEIARRLFVSLETVKHHVRAILAKLGARTRAHAVAEGYRRGLLELGGQSGELAA